MSFECKYFNKNSCELLQKECKSGQKGCVLRKANVLFISEKMKTKKKIKILMLNKILIFKVNKTFKSNERWLPLSNHQLIINYCLFHNKWITNFIYSNL